MMIPIPSPASPSHGVVPVWLSSQSPNPVPPSVGTNIRQVVSAMVLSNKITVEEVCGGRGVLEDGLLGALMYSCYYTSLSAQLLHAQAQ